MAAFTLHLSEGIHAVVRKGEIRRKTLHLFFRSWKKGKEDNTKRIVYIINIASPTHGRQEYFLCKAVLGGQWLSTDEKKNLFPKEKWAALEEDALTAEVKKAIEQYENKQ